MIQCLPTFLFLIKDPFEVSKTKIHHIWYVQSAQGQRAKATRGFAGVVSVRDSLFFYRREREKETPEAAFSPQILTSF